MSADMREKKRSELLRVCDELTKEENPLSEQEVHFIETCCHILKVSDDDKVNHMATTAMSKGEGDPCLIIAPIRKLLEALGNEAEACRRISSFRPDHDLPQLGLPGGPCAQLRVLEWERQEPEGSTAAGVCDWHQDASLCACVRMPLPNPTNKSFSYYIVYRLLRNIYRVFPTHVLSWCSPIGYNWLI